MSNRHYFRLNLEVLKSFFVAFLFWGNMFFFLLCFRLLTTSLHGQICFFAPLLLYVYSTCLSSVSPHISKPTISTIQNLFRSYVFKFETGSINVKKTVDVPLRTDCNLWFYEFEAMGLCIQIWFKRV